MNTWNGLLMRVADARGRHHLHPFTTDKDTTMRFKTNPGLAVATAAAMLFGSALTSTAAAADATVHCTGVNSCKGQSACKGANNACKGQNSCKGQGFLVMSKQDCKAAQAKAEGNKS